MFSSRSFIVSDLTFRSLIHFELIFVYGVRKCSSFLLLQMVDQFSQHHLLKRLSFLCCMFLPRLRSLVCMCISELQSKLSGPLMIFLAWNVGKFQEEGKTVLLGVAWVAWRLFLFWLLKPGLVLISLLCTTWPQDTPQPGTFHASMYHSAMALPYTEKVESLLCLILSPLHGAG